MKRILITGGTGFIGGYLIPHLLQSKQYNITIFTRNASNQAFGKQVEYISDFNNVIFNFDIVINLAGEPIDQRWSSSNIEKIYNSRIGTTKLLVDKFKECSTKPELFISGSAIGYYGVSLDKIFTEDDEIDDNQSNMLFSSKLCKDWEDTAYEATKIGIRTCTIRTGLVLEKNGGILAKLSRSVKMFLGGKISAGTQQMSWIHMHDWIRIIDFIIENQSIYGPINATAPNPASNEEFTIALGDALFRPIFFRIPAFIFRFIFGKMADELLLSGQKVLPKKLTKLGFKFKHKNIRDTLKSIY